MQIHEITEAVRTPINTGLAQRSQQRNAGVEPVAQDEIPVVPPVGADVFGQMVQQVAPPVTPAGPTTSSTGGTTTPTAHGLTHTATTTNPNVIAQHPETQKAQQQWDIVNQQLKKQYPGQTEQYYQQAMLKKMGYARPGVFRPTTTAKATVKPVPVTTTPPVTTTIAAPPVTTTIAAPPVTAPLKQFPPITLGTGPKAQIYINKGRGYVDSKTNKPMPPSIVKAMGL